jgi:hypothetical protein
MSDQHSDDTPKLHIDSDWKAEVQAEKEKLAAAESDSTPKEADPRGELPPADFKGLMGILASQAVMGLGSMSDPNGGGVMVDLVGAKFAIDLLGVLQEKTAGNLEEQEGAELDQILTELRSRFVQIADLIAQQKAGVMPTGEAPSPGNVIQTP